MDRMVGKVIDAARSRPDGRDTVIIYCSDHGDMASEQYGMWWKSCFFEGSARIPMIMSWPGRFDQGKSVSKVVNLIDAGPTLLDLAGAEPLPYASGRSLCGFLSGAGPNDWPDETWSEYLGSFGEHPSCMIRSGPWKLMYYPEYNTFLLFNLEKDPRELHDRANDPSCKDVARELLAKVRGHWSPETMLRGHDRSTKWWRIIQGCGHDLVPHALPQLEVPEGANEFDFSQVPGWNAIRTRHFPENT